MSPPTWSDRDRVEKYFTRDPKGATDLFESEADDQIELDDWETKMFPTLPEDERQIILKKVQSILNANGFDKTDVVLVLVNSEIIP